MIKSARLSGVPAIVGGLLWAIVPFLDDVSGVPAPFGIHLLRLLSALDSLYPLYEQFLISIPPFLLIGTYGLHLQSDGKQGSLGKEELLPLTVGLAFLLLAAIIYVYSTVGQAGIITLFFVGGPAILGVILVAVGSAFTAYTLWKQGEIPLWVTLLFGLALPFDPLFNALITPLFSVGLSIYGISWIVMGWYLLTNSMSLSEG